MGRNALVGVIGVAVIVVGVVSAGWFFAGGWQGQNGLESYLSVYPTVESTDDGYDVSGALGSSGFEGERGVARGVRVRMLDADNETISVVELGDIELASIDDEAYRFNVTTEREPVRFVIELDAVTDLAENHKLVVEGRERVSGGGWEPFYQDEDTWKYRLTASRELMVDTAA